MPEGRMSGTAIVGRTVRRPVGRWTPAVHALLGHLESVRFEGAPRVLGFDEQGREVLTFLPSEALTRRDAPRTPASADALGKLLRQYHDAVASFDPPPAAPWRLGRESGTETIICHNDVNPGNVVYRNGLPYGLIDWDLAGPALPLDDLARACILFGPLVPDDVARAWGYDERELEERPTRIVSLCH